MSVLQLPVLKLMLALMVAPGIARMTTTLKNRTSGDTLRDLNMASMLTEEEYDSILQKVLSSETSGRMSNGVSIVDQMEELERSREFLEEHDYKTKKRNY
eukprot:535465_1